MRKRLPVSYTIQIQHSRTGMSRHRPRHSEMQLLLGWHHKIRGMDRPPPPGGGLQQTPTPSTEPAPHGNAGKAHGIQLLRHLDARQKPPHRRRAITRPSLWPLRALLRTGTPRALSAPFRHVADKNGPIPRQRIHGSDASLSIGKECDAH